MATMTSFLPVNNGVGGPAAAPSADPARTLPKSSPLPPPSSQLNLHRSSPPEQKTTTGTTSPPTTSSPSQHYQQNGTHDTDMDIVKAEPPTAEPSSPSKSIGKPHGRSDGSPAHSDGRTHESDGEHEAGSDNEDGDAESGPPSKKKKGQRFFCTDFPPCNLSFTRSEHLARHIRKHTGERPFQCHCSRRFSRLDNLRQHAQTVHVNEDIPGDSLAATVSRVQRQVRTDRIRGVGRARSGTTGSQSGLHSRGHSRNLSASSIASAVSSYGPGQDPRRRPAPLLVANDPSSRAKLTLDTMASPPQTPPSQTHGFSGHSPAGSFYTPASATNYSAVPGRDPGNPYFASPTSSTSAYWPDRGTPRRLSFPAGTRPFDMPQPGTYPPPYRRQPGLPAANPPYGGEQPPPAFAPSPSSAKPPQESDPDSDWRRRTWHPASPSAFVRPATSGLWFSQSSSDTQQQQQQQQPSSSLQPPRLPGIESFDRVQECPSAPPRREPTPMQVDQPPTSSAPSGDTSFHPPPPNQRPAPPISGPGHRRGTVSIDTTLHRNLTKLDLHGNPPQDAPSWGQQTMNDLQGITGSRPATSGHYQASTQQAPPSFSSPHPSEHPQGPEAGQAASNRDKRQGWLDGAPVQSSAGQQAPQPPHQEATPAGSVDQRRHSYLPFDYHSQPASQLQQDSNPASTDVKHESQGSTTSAQQEGGEGGMGRLEALVAVATSESKNDHKYL